MRGRQPEVSLQAGPSPKSCRVGATSAPQVLRPSCTSGGGPSAKAWEHLLGGATQARDSGAPRQLGLAELTCPAQAIPAPPPVPPPASSARAL